MRIATIPVLVLAGATFLCSCRSRAPEANNHDHEDGEGGTGAHEEHGEAPVVELEGLRGIRWIQVPERRAEGAWFPGEAIGDESSQAVLSSPVGGQVASPPLAPGRAVRRGAELMRINSPEQAELFSKWLVAKADVERAEAALGREERLFAGGATSQREMEEARREAAVARAESEAARLGLEARGLKDSDASGRFVLRAPSDGAVVRWNVRNGQGIEAGQDLGAFQATSASLVRVDLMLPGPDWRVGDETGVRSSDGRRWKARVVGVPAVLTEDTRRLTYRLELTEGELPLPGQPVEVRVPFAAAVILPQAAVQQIEGTWGVFVKSGDHAEFHRVRRGVELGSDVVIAEGVLPGEEVVTEGAYLLKSLWLKETSGGEVHEH